MKAFWHGHHNRLISWFETREERVKEIHDNKPEREWELRERLLKPVEGELPEELVTARTAYETAWTAYDTAEAKHMHEIIALHAKECPDCPWDGHCIPGIGN
jgi:hypothetical protein